jgi:hypothetical protein
MRPHPSSGPSVVFAASLVVITAGTWWWRAHVFRGQQAEVTGGSWEHVKNEYPLSSETPEPPKLSPEMVEAVVRANPFSPDRRLLPSPTNGEPEGEGGVSEPVKPKFVYKGRIDLGKRQRAIVEDTTTHKTHFLEVGQEVTGFKVLDISESQVVLSDLNTSENVVLSLTSRASP